METISIVIILFGGAFLFTAALYGVGRLLSMIE